MTKDAREFQGDAVIFVLYEQVSILAQNREGILLRIEHGAVIWFESTRMTLVGPEVKSFDEN